MALLSLQLDLGAKFLDLDRENDTKGYPWRRQPN